MNAAGLSQRSQMTRLAQILHLWPDLHLLHFLIFWEEVFHSPGSSFRNAEGMSKLPDVRFLSCLYIYCHLHWTPLELFFVKKAAFCSVSHCLTSAAVCSAGLPCNTSLSLQAQGVCTVPAQRHLPNSLLAPAGTRSNAPCCVEKP